MVKHAADEMTDEGLSHLYRQRRQDVAPARLDTLILSEARKAATASARVARSPFSSAWAMPVSAVAVIALAVGLVLFMAQEGVAPLSERVTIAPSVPVAPTESRQNEAPAKMETARRQATPEIASATPPPLAQAKRDAPLVPTLAPPATAAPTQTPVAREALAKRTDVAPEAPTFRVAPEVRTIEKAKLYSRTVSAATASAADIVSVQVKGAAGAYEFSVSVRSPDTGCQKYADWWEVLSEDGRLLYRRILTHSHANEQPFKREGGPVAIQPDTVVWVRAHMHPTGYGGAAFKGSARAGFKRAELNATFAAALAQEPPQPGGCDS